MDQKTDVVRNFKSKIRDMFIVGNNWNRVKELGGQSSVAKLLNITQPNICKKARLMSVSPPRAQFKRNKRSDAFTDEEASLAMEEHWVSFLM
jgi:hypothetical protein